MTISTDTATASYTGNGTTTAFPIPFYFLVDTDVKISKKVGATGAISVLTLNSDYTLTGAGNQAGGTATMTVAPLGGTTPDQLFIERNVDAVQETAYPENGIFPAASHEKALDRLTMLAQQILSKLTFGLFRDPLTSTYDIGGNLLSNVGTAVADTDVPGKLQVTQIAEGVAAGIPGGVGSFTQSGVGAVARTFQDRMRDWVSAFDFMTAAQIADVRANTLLVDVTAALNAAIQKAPAGVTLYLPPGSYRTSDVIHMAGSGKSIKGAGVDVTNIVSFTANAAVLRFGDGSGFLTASDMTLSHNGTPTAGGDGFLSQGAVSNATIFNIKAKNNYNGFNLQVTDYGIVWHCRAFNNKGNGFYFTNSATNGQVQWYLTECLSQYNDVDGYRLASQTGPAQMIVGDFDGCRTYGNSGHGLGAYGTSSVPIQDLKMFKCFFGGDNSDEIYLDTYGQSIAIRDTFLELCGGGGTGSLQNSAASNTGNGVTLTVNNVDVDITNSYINAMKLNGIQTSATSCKVTGTTIYNCGVANVSANRNGIWHAAGRLMVSGGAIGSPATTGSQLIGIFSFDGSKAAAVGVDFSNNSAGPISVQTNPLLLTTVGCLPNSAAVQIPATSGMVIGAPTGGLSGTGTINVAGNLLKNGTIYGNP